MPLRVGCISSWTLPKRTCEFHSGFSKRTCAFHSELLYEFHSGFPKRTVERVNTST
ncbi:hypothetical protein GLOIN_2v1782565 [Rhizophagus irregularis DAOM 181602=DAOM 197198]|uniref:Uncharacterized protein n=1 Tax=Rhizophagus irregularis (strain DAOM 181602 / DAOM 197198 / MUCL 43194) TaxID=747089 RepID=A0A2P4PH40_RHIID|nr:hypothetical protein GLOIN_2v1782565 [Rhizophagus irregularis DAOM 181602=DAOM 197198]POG64701.1 hypothetical protein GLOIN_2v1782565 [Rhizophagus irregularis DAOM 181602=DAOM 197198]|eukprot:XP_025171567.1 hypothetical protein GLOIN_2v1782565 [Rhizophagus irregularis DAOM 181602=DAOM 197198]